jgi:hypothetical protein
MILFDPLLCFAFRRPSSGKYAAHFIRLSFADFLGELL